MQKKSVKQLRKECKEKGLVYDVKTKQCRPRKKKDQIKNQKEINYIKNPKNINYQKEI